MSKSPGGRKRRGAARQGRTRHVAPRPPEPPRSIPLGERKNQQAGWGVWRCGGRERSPPREMSSWNPVEDMNQGDLASLWRRRGAFRRAGRWGEVSRSDQTAAASHAPAGEAGLRGRARAAAAMANAQGRGLRCAGGARVGSRRGRTPVQLGLSQHHSPPCAGRSRPGARGVTGQAGRAGRGKERRQRGAAGNLTAARGPPGR